MIFKNSLDKIIQSMVLPQFPWIVDYEILMERAEHMDRDYYRINYFVATDDLDIDETFTVREDMKVVEELTKSLFKMVGPDYRKQIFEGVEFYAKQK
jgi:hypothetical protein